VERIGVSIAREAMQAADIILFVVDATSPATNADVALAEELRGSVPIESVDHATLVRKAKAAPRTGHHQQ